MSGRRRNPHIPRIKDNGNRRQQTRCHHRHGIPKARHGTTPLNCLDFLTSQN
ncbi:Uncharacterised protein [Mycobacteroides abscessus subsp. abscessus]|nr:Uncharacterised protein [Mycobacteroides abscessus subsp. abscessus]